MADRNVFMKCGSFVLVLLMAMAVCMVSGCTDALDDAGGMGSMDSVAGDLPVSSIGDESDAALETAMSLASSEVIECIDDYQDLLDSFDGSDVSYIVFDGDAVTAGEGVDVDGTVVYITMAGTYSVSGSSDEGRIVVDLSDKGYVKIILDGLELGSSSGSPVVVEEAKSTVIELADGTENIIVDESAYVDDDVDEEAETAAIYSKDDLYVVGSGSLSVYAEEKNGIQGKDQVVIADGVITIDAGKEAVKAKDYILVDGGSLSLGSGEDGMVATEKDDPENGFIVIRGGDIEIDSAQDGIQAENCIIINGGSLDIKTQGSSDSLKGIKVNNYLEVNGGVIDIDSADDSINSKNDVIIKGGTITASSDDDGVHAEAGITINGGDLTLEGYEGLEGKSIVINGGDIRISSSDDGINVATGSSGQRMDNMVYDGLFLTINGGYVYIEAEGDGLDSNGNFYMTGGTVIVNGPLLNNNGGLDVNGEAVVDGGTLLIAGSLGMAEAPDSSSSQNSVSFGFSSQLAAGTLVYIESDDGDFVAAFEPSKAFQSLVFSSDGLVTGETYRIYTGGSGSGESVDGVYDAVSEKGTLLQEFTVSSVTTFVGSAGGMRPGMNTGMATGMRRMR